MASGSDRTCVVGLGSNLFRSGGPSEVVVGTPGAKASESSDASGTAEARETFGIRDLRTRVSAQILGEGCGFERETGTSGSDDAARRREGVKAIETETDADESGDDGKTQPRRFDNHR